MELSRELGMMPQKLLLYAIEGRDFSVGNGLSEEVDQALSEVEEKLFIEFREYKRRSQNA